MLANSADKLSERLEVVDGASLATRTCVGQVATSFEKSTRDLADASSRLEQMLQDALRRVESVAVEAQKLVESSSARTSAHLGSEVARLRAEIGSVEDVVAADVAEVRKVVQASASTQQLAEITCDATSAVAATCALEARLGKLSEVVDKQRSFVEDGVQNLQARCQEIHGDFGNLRACTQKETATLGSEVSLLRAAAGSLTQGVVAGFQTIGFLKLDADEAGHTAPIRDMCDLLEWEKGGCPLSARVANGWAAAEPQQAPNMLALLAQKASEDDLRMVLATAVRMQADASRPWSSSATVAGEFSTPPLVARHGRDGEVGMVREWSLTPTPPLFRPHSCVAPRNIDKLNW